MADMESYRDEIIILQVKNWQTADKKAVCFSKEHGKIVFLAYGARYSKSKTGRLVQPLFRLQAEFYPGNRLDKLKSCELAAPMPEMDIDRLAYGFLMAEATDRLTEQGEPSEGIYRLLEESLVLLEKRNPRLAAMIYLIQLLDHCGIGPVYEVCVNCSRPAQGNGWFSSEQGGFICGECGHGKENSGALLPFGEEARMLWQQLRMLDFAEPGHFTVKGGTLMEVEKILHHYVVYQTEQPLKSLDFIRQIGKASQ